VLFGVLGLALVGIATVVVRSTMRRDRGEHTTATGP
jgi:hypothetical protein